MPILAISGPDNVGKTSQIRLLTRRIPGSSDAGRLDDFDPRWQQAHAGGLAHWWFTDAPLEEVADVLACSYLERARHAHRREGLVLMDRGHSMLEASVVATAAVRLGLDHEHAADHARRLLAPYDGDLGQAFADMAEIMLLHADDPATGAARALSRERSTTARYRAYQHMLNRHLHQRPHPSSATIVTGTQPIIQVQRQLCRLLPDHGIDVLPPTICGVHVIALGGLSECGKSSAGAYLAERHGSARLKIGYLLQAAAARHQIADVYALPPLLAAELLVDELDRYCAAHHYQEIVSIESLHSRDLCGALKPLLGDGVTVAYLDADLRVRQERGTAGPGDVTERDAVKRSRGADQVKTLADVVVDNNGPLYALYHRLDRLVRERAWTLASPRLTGIDALGLPDHLTGFLRALTGELTPALVDLVAVTGSASRGGYHDGWSDLDIVLLADGEPDTAAIGDVVARHEPRLDGVKLGLTLISAAECRAGVLPSRLLHTLASITAGTTPVLWHSPGLRLPRPAPATVAVASAADATAAAVQIRRLLIRRPLQVRSLYKQTALLAKIVLGAEGQHHVGDADALAAFLTLTSLTAPAAELPGHTNPETVAGLARQVLGWWLASLREAR
ncbi:hypothetical protein ACFLIM_41165 [Nonomuraea sp. M3C6]|uniref:Polymerase nucleotidyl transferase domain-containing protein n=1 Tax=Nonomuraea marmarensis TaxID=3351344 RepID=A0ABW7AQD5_9ACTN